MRALCGRLRHRVGFRRFGQDHPAAANGLTIAGLDIKAEEGEKTWEMALEMGGTLHFLKTDLLEDRDIEHAGDEAAAMGTIKYLANIAGIQPIDAVEDFSMEKYDLMQRLMLRAPFYLSKLVIPHLKKSRDGASRALFGQPRIYQCQWMHGHEYCHSDSNFEAIQSWKKWLDWKRGSMGYNNRRRRRHHRT